MQKISLYLVALSLFVLAACSKDSGGNDPLPEPIDKSLNLKATGESAQDILANDVYTNMLIEIAYVKDFRPTDEALANFITYLQERTFKQNIQLIFNELESPNEENLTLTEIAQLESDNRTAYNNGDTLAVYIYFADSPAEDDDEEEGLVTLGAVYRNTSMIIHEVTIKKLAGQSPFISNADVESVTLNHEFGHLFGLVNLGTPAVNPHEDLDAANHCIVDGCLMKAELQFGGPSNKSSFSSAKINNENGLKAGCSLSGQSVLQMLQKQTAKGLAPALPLDPECILDLQANGGR